jgi:hypothetical protein
MKAERASREANWALTPLVLCKQMKIEILPHVLLVNTVLCITPTKGMERFTELGIDCQQFAVMMFAKGFQLESKKG